MNATAERSDIPVVVRRRPPVPAAGDSVAADSATVRREQIRRAYSERQDLPGIDPTRYGDWEYNGRCTDF